MPGKLDYITLRPQKKGSVILQETARAIENFGLEGDHYNKSGKREVTLIQSEHLEELSASLKKPVPKGITRRNLVVSGIDIQNLKQKYFQIGNALFFCTGDCPPCERMNEVLGEGAMEAMSGKGGITAKVVQSGTIQAGDEIIIQ